MPEFLRRENANQVPANALWLTNICVQVFLVVVFFTSGDPDGMDPYTKMLLLATSMILIPYFWSAAYGLLLTLKARPTRTMPANAARTWSSPASPWPTRSGCSTPGA